MTAPVHCRVAAEAEIAAAALLAIEVFDEFVAPLYSHEGREEFHRYAAVEALQLRSRGDHLTLIAERGGRVIGMLHLRQWRHVAMLFVARSHQRTGVGRTLLGTAIQLIHQQGASSGRLTVNSSPNSVEAYRQLGFSPVGPEQVVRGIRFVPMELRLSNNCIAKPGATNIPSRSQ